MIFHKIFVFYASSFRKITLTQMYKKLFENLNKRMFIYNLKGKP